MTLAVRRYEPGDEAAWDQLVDRSRSGHFMFRRGYMDYHADRFQDHSLLVYDGSKLVAALPANVDGTALVSHGGLTFGGLQIGDSTSARRVLEIFSALREHLRDLRIFSLLYKAVPHIYHRVPSEEDLHALFVEGAALVRRDVSAAIRLDARLPYTKGRKAAVKAAQRAEIEVGPSDDFDGFMALQEEVLRSRYDAEPVHASDELALLASRFPGAITLHTARVAGRLVAGVVVYRTEIVAHAQYIAANEEGRETHALDKLLDGLIAADQGSSRWWDFGTSNDRATGSLNEALIRNKESYGARAVVYDQYLLDLAA
ncbi:MAG: hypothetical protein QOI10_2621 [Solirubrobacterales bacterium]|nr:hypothetical protein [Solirubrobacterales bacterium]